MIEFPNSLKPFFVDNEDLIRLGSIDDGGYVVPIQTVNSSKVLLSFGISDNWEFEKDFLKKTSAKLLAYDHTIDKEFWLSKFKKDLRNITTVKDVRFVGAQCAITFDNSDLANQIQNDTMGKAKILTYGGGMNGECVMVLPPINISGKILSTALTQLLELISEMSNHN